MLLRIAASFLSERELVVRHMGMQSERMSMPAGGPQGSSLGCFIFLVLINFLCIQPISVPIKNHVSKPISKRKPIEKTNAKFIDDMTLALSLNLKDKLRSDHEVNLTRPLEFHKRTSHFLPIAENSMQKEVDSINTYAEQKGMKINTAKTKIMLFNTRKNFDFMPEVKLGEDMLEVVEVTKLLGVMIRSDLKWSDNTDHICKKGFNRMWMIRRLKVLGAGKEELIDVYKQHIMSVLELAAPVWSPGLTKGEVKQIERVQKVALHIILGSEYHDYEKALDMLRMKPLSTRREDICIKFAKKSFNSPKFNQWFSRNDNLQNGRETRNKKLLLNPIRTRTVRYENSTLPYLTDLLNNCSWNNEEQKFM